MHKKRLIPIYALTMLASAILLIKTSCSQEEAEIKEIRAHDQVLEGVPHAAGLNHAERYCQRCHGQGLVGGSNQEPNCYTCHGKNWLDSDPHQVYAPPSHTQQYSLWFHDPNHTDAEGNCSACHGDNLQGTSVTPSCYLCHEKKW